MGLLRDGTRELVVRLPFVNLENYEFTSVHVPFNSTFKKRKEKLHKSTAKKEHGIIIISAVDRRRLIITIIKQA